MQTFSDIPNSYVIKPNNWDILQITLFFSTYSTYMASMRKTERKSVQVAISTFIYQKVIFRGMSSNQYTVSLFFINIYNEEQDYIPKGII